MKNIFGKKSSKEELENVMFCLMVVCACCLLFVFFRNLNLCYDLGKDDTDGLIVKLLPENVTLLAMAICSVLIYLMLRNVQKGLVFTKQNSDLIMTIGVVLECNVILQCLFVRCEGWEYHSDDLSVVGCILPFHRLPVQGRHTDEGRAGLDYLK